MEDIFTYIHENQINFTGASIAVLQNNTLLSHINYNRGYIITTVEQKIEAIKNSFLQNYYLNQFIKQLWYKSITYFIPEGYFQPAYIIFTNEGWANIQNIDVYLGLFFRNEMYRLLKPLSGISSLSSKQPLILNFSIAEFLSNLIMLSFNPLVEEIFRILLDQGHVINDILIYFNQLFKESNISAKIHFNGIFRFIPLNF